MAKTYLLPKVHKVNFTEFGFHIEVKSALECDERMENLASQMAHKSLGLSYKVTRRKKNTDEKKGAKATPAN